MLSTSTVTIDAALSDVEQALADVGEAMKASQAQELQLASGQLKKASVHFSSVLANAGSRELAPAVVVRLRSVAARLASQRDALARMSALVDRQVATLVPQKPAAATYGGSTGRGMGAGGRYGSGH